MLRSLTSLTIASSVLLSCFGLTQLSWAEDDLRPADSELEFDIDFDESEWEAMDAGDNDASDFHVLDSDSGPIIIQSGTDNQRYEIGLFHRLAFYYSSIGYTFQTREDASVVILNEDELSVYTGLLQRTLRPSLLSVEMGVYPMSLLGVLTRKHYQNFYDDMAYDEDFNLVESLTAGFNEPYSLSLLLHNVSIFNPEDSDSYAAPNVAFMGYLFSVGDRHIYQNELIDDVWYEMEWKAKGSFNVKQELLDWTLRLGIKNHRNSDITDSAYIKFEKNNIMVHGPFWQWRSNTGFKLNYMVSRKNLAPTEISAFITKFFPVFGRSDYIPAISLGVIRQKSRKYSDDFQEEFGKVNNYTIAIQPTIIF